MPYQPESEDRRQILQLAEQGLSVRKIADLVPWSRPTIAKVLREEGWDPKRPKLPHGVGEQYPQKEDVLPLGEIFRLSDEGKFEESDREWAKLERRIRRVSEEQWRYPG